MDTEHDLVLRGCHYIDAMPELEAKIRRLGPKSFRSLTLVNFTAKNLRVPIFTMLKARHLEFTSLEVISCERSHSSVLEFLSTFMEGLSSVKRLNLTSIEEKDLSAKLISHLIRKTELSTVYIRDIGFSVAGMRSFCGAISSRSVPLKALCLGISSSNEEALAVLGVEIPNFKLESLMLSIHNDNYSNLSYIYKGLCQCTALTFLSLARNYRNAPADPTTEMFEAILNVLRTLPSLTAFQFFGVSSFTKEQWKLLGRVIGDRPKLEKFIVDTVEPIDAATLDSILDAIGFHPRLKYFTFSVGPSHDLLLRTKHRLARLHTLAAKQLTILVAGSMIARIGRHSTVYKVSLDVFRKLQPFLA